MKVKIKRIIIILSALVFLAPIIFYTAISIKFNAVKSYIVSESKNANVSVSLVIAVAYTESKFNVTATSSKGAVGVMQIMPSTAKFIGEKHNVLNYSNLKDAKTNIKLGVLYLKYLLNKYDSEIIALASYNAGEGNVVKWLNNKELKIENIPYNETQNYVKKVIKRKKIIENSNLSF